MVSCRGVPGVTEAFDDICIGIEKALSEGQTSDLDAVEMFMLVQHDARRKRDMVRILSRLPVKCDENSRAVKAMVDLGFFVTDDTWATTRRVKKLRAECLFTSPVGF